MKQLSAHLFYRVEYYTYTERPATPETPACTVSKQMTSFVKAENVEEAISHLKETYPPKSTLEILSVVRSNHEWIIF